MTESYLGERPKIPFPGATPASPPLKGLGGLSALLDNGEAARAERIDNIERMLKAQSDISEAQFDLTRHHGEQMGDKIAQIQKQLNELYGSSKKNELDIEKLSWIARIQDKIEARFGANNFVIILLIAIVLLQAKIAFGADVVTLAKLLLGK